MKKKSITCIALFAVVCTCSYPERYKPLLDLRGPRMCGMELYLPAGEILEQETVQARAYVILDSGRKEVAESATWETMNDDVITVDRNGSVTGLKPGTGSVMASLDGFTATGSVEVLRRVDYSKVVISEVFYDAEGSDDGKEFIEIYNDNDYSCDISGLRVVDGAASSRDFVFPPGSTIGPKSYAVIAQSAEGFSALFGNHPEFGNFSFSLNNSGETVMLKKADGSVLDAVYIKGGTDDFRPPESWSPLPLPAAAAGQSVYRVNINSVTTAADWSSGAPTPGL